MRRMRNLTPSHRKALDRNELDLGEGAVVTEDVYKLLERAERK